MSLILQSPWFAALIAFATALTSTAGLVKWQSQIGVFDMPNIRSSHHRPKPRTGGIALLAAVLLPYAIGVGTYGSIIDIKILTIAICFFGLGLADDLWHLPQWLRLAAQAVLAFSLTAWGMRLKVLELPGLGPLQVPELILLGLSVFWICGFVNLFNFMDGIDGIAALQAATVGIFMYLLTDSPLPLIISGACLGFLPFNHQPSKIFMGDGGSYLLGCLLAVFSLVSSGTADVIPFSVFVMLFGVFIADATVTLVSRAIRREPLFHAHRSHHYQKLIDLGWTHAQVSWLYTSFALGLGLTALWYIALPATLRGLLAVTWVAVIGMLFRWIHNQTNSKVIALEGHRPIFGKIDGSKIYMNFSFRRLLVIAMDMAMVVLTLGLAFLLRFDFVLDPDTLWIVLYTLPFVMATYLLSGSVFSMYRGLIYFCSFPDLLRILNTVATAGILNALIIFLTHQDHFPRSVLLLHPLLSFLGICGIRFCIRQGKSYAKSKKLSIGEARDVLIIGAGDLGESLLRQMLKTPNLNYRIVGFIDDDPSKWGMHIHGYPILGGRSQLRNILGKWKIDEIVIAIATRRGEILSGVIEALRGFEKKPDLKIAPTLDEMLKTRGKDFSIRKVKPTDLLNRDVVRLDEARIARVLADKVVLVTGAGGTIGRELCMQALRYHPKRIILFENHATSLFYCEEKLRKLSRTTEIVPILGDVRDQSLIDRIFKIHRPHAILHAAAHKHVHQLECNIQEGVSNNILGTYNLCLAADRFGAETFLLISTDKAVRPTSVMGATKRVAELIVSYFAQTTSQTYFIAVRFGNVLGSSGSALRIFQDQIAGGGPITVTDPQATRYFMTVEEAVGLILQAVSMATGGAVFVLKMGTPVRIMDMANNLILLSGLEPGKDIEIQITGLRQGEKLNEELIEDPSEVLESGHPQIMLLQSSNTPPKDMAARVLELEILCRGTDTAPIVRKIQELVSTFQPSVTHLPDPLPVSTLSLK